MSQKLGFDGFLGRWIFALVLVLGTYNPSGFSYVTWVLEEETTFGPVVAIVGLGSPQRTVVSCSKGVPWMVSPESSTSTG